MNLCKITIIGNSVAFRVRPPGQWPLNQNYGQILEKTLNGKSNDTIYLVTNKAFYRASVTDIYKRIDDIIKTYPDYYIINTGVVEASTREIPFWMAQIIYYEKPLILHYFLQAIHLWFIEPLRPFFVRLRGKKAWFSPEKFEAKLKKIINTLRKETNAQIILLGMPRKTTQRVIKLIPGSEKNYPLYDDIIRKVAEEQNLVYVATNDLVPDTHFPDGIHFSYEGHKIIAGRLAEKILLLNTKKII